MKNKYKDKNEKIILTGDRPTGPLHLGHYVGSLANRIKMHKKYKTYILLADIQALTDNFKNPEKVRKNILTCYKDYLSVGIDPKRANIFIQSMIPEIAELTILFMNLVSHKDVLRNPTVKSEIKQKDFGTKSFSVPFGFIAYPVSQAADILIVKGNTVPVGEDQRPMIEITRKIARRFNKNYQNEVFPLPNAKIGKVTRLPGIDGNAKMSKSLGNAINLSDDKETVKKKVFQMYTDPNRIHATDPGQVEGNPVFIYHDAFNDNVDEVDDLKKRYKNGKVGDVEVKEKLFQALEKFFEPIRQRREKVNSRTDQELMDELFESTKRVKKVAENTMIQVKESMKIDY